VLHAQPLFSIARGVLVGHEVLARLRRRDGTIVAPGAFMPAVERFGLAPRFDAHVLERAMRLAAPGRPLHVNWRRATCSGAAGRSRRRAPASCGRPRRRWAAR
jgi:EAL domain-containing protein (putative c-di-GMP-specific phosphodiesterase class I)